MHASCPACRTAIVGPRLPESCPACGEGFGLGEKEEAPAGSPSVLVLQAPDGLAAEFPIDGLASIGRHYENTVVVADREVSKRHAVVEQRADGFVLRDLGSSNGTFVNGRRVDELVLRDGDEIVVGGSRIVFRSPPADAKDGEGGRVAVVQAPSFTQVIASARPRALSDQDEFVPAAKIADVDSLRADYERLRIAYRFHQEGGVITDQGELFRLILKLALEWLPADNGVVLVPDASGGFTVAEADSRRGEAEIAVSRTLLDQVNKTGEGILSSDAVTDQRFASSESMVSRGVRSVLAVPVVTRETIRAIVYLDSMSRVDAFTPKDLDILTSIAAQAGVALLNADLIQRIKHEEATRSQLERFLSPALVHKAAKGELDLKKGGSLVRATILFSDIRGFTAMSERLSAEEVVRLLNEHFEDMVEVVFDFNGVLDKFLGDAVMALWGVPVGGPDDADRAVRAALEMQRRVDAMNARQAERGRPTIGLGIGVNTGECVVGNMGSSRRLEYTVIGDTVNLASRLCSLAGPGEIVVSDHTRDALAGEYDLEALPAQQVKGKSRPVSLFRVTGRER
jgi:adenylate cyclase